MRRKSLLLIAMCCVALAAPAQALMVVERPVAKSEAPIISIQAHVQPHHCPPGTRWVAARYGRAGKWRNAHCTTWVRRAHPGDNMANQLNSQQLSQPPGGMPYGQPAPAQSLPPGYR